MRGPAGRVGLEGWAADLDAAAFHRPHQAQRVVEIGLPRANGIALCFDPALAPGTDEDGGAITVAGSGRNAVEKERRQDGSDGSFSLRWRLMRRSDSSESALARSMLLRRSA